MVLVSALAGAEPFVWEPYVRNGWKVIATAAGDLNRDQRDDAVLMLEENNPKNLKPHSGSWPKVLNLNPRRLVILFKTADGYQEVLRRDGFFPSEHAEDLPYLEDTLPKNGVRIIKGVLALSLHERLSYGHYDEIDHKFKFRYDSGDNEFRLIGYDRSELLRGAGKRIDHSINYLTGKEKITTELFSAPMGCKPDVYWTALPENPRIDLRNASAHLKHVSESRQAFGDTPHQKQ